MDASADRGRPALLLDNVVKCYGPIRAVDGVSLQAHGGEFIALLGPTEPASRRCSSSSPVYSPPIPVASRSWGTTCRATPYRHWPSSASCFSSRRSIWSSRSPPTSCSMPAFTACRAPSPGAIDSDLVRLGLEDRADDKAAKLSGGNRRRVELARALAARAAGAADGRADGRTRPGEPPDLLKLLLSMRAERSVAVLWATHLCDEVADADRVIVLHRGKILADTTPRATRVIRRRGHDRGSFPGDDRRRRATRLSH